MSEVHSEVVGTGVMRTGGVHGVVGGRDLWGNKIVKIDEVNSKITVEYGEVVLKSGEVVELNYNDFERLTRRLDSGEKGMFKVGNSHIDIVMIGKMTSKTRVEDAPVEMNEETRDKHLKHRVLKHYKAETNWEKKGWKWQDISVADGNRIQKALLTNADKIREKVRQLVPVYAMEYVIETVDGKQVRVERKIDHKYPNIPMERITDNGEEVVMWYWAKVYDDKERSKGKIGFKKVWELVFDETKGDYVRPTAPDMCSPDEIAQLDRRG